MIEVEIEGEVVRETERAWLIDVDGDEIWLPKSICTDNEDGTFTVPEWLAIEKGLV